MKNNSTNKRRSKISALVIGIALFAMLLGYWKLFQDNIVMLFILINLMVTFGLIVALLMLLPNSKQRRITEKDMVGYGIAMLGLLLFGLAGCFGTRIFTPSLHTIDVSSFFGMLFANVAGVPLGLGVTIALPNDITDPFLDTKNIWKLAVALAILIGISSFIFS